MFKINFEPKEQQECSSMMWHYGEAIKDNKSFPFTLCEMYDSTTNTSSFEVTWIEETPEGITDQEIINQFESLDE